MMLKIMNRTSQAPPRWEPEKREPRPSFFGEFLIRMAVNATSPTRQASAMKSCRKPSTGQVPMSGIWKSECPVIAP